MALHDDFTVWPSTSTMDLNMSETLIVSCSSSTWETADSSVMRKWKWLLVNGYVYRMLISTAIKSFNLYPMNAPDPFKSASYETTKWVRCGHLSALHSHVQT